MCDCLETVLKNVEDQVKPKEQVLDWKADWKDSVFRFDGGCGVGLRVEYEYRHIKKDKTPYKNLKKSDVFIAMSYCPFCGKSMKKEEKVS